MAFDICYIVSHGFASRMIMQTNLLGRLVEAGKTVAIITPDKNDASLMAYCSKHNVSIFEFNKKSSFQSENYIFKRKYFLEDIGANPALLEKHIHAVRYNTSKHPLRKLRPYYYYLVNKLIKAIPSIKQNFKAKESLFFRSQEAVDLLTSIAPKKLISLYPVNFLEALLLQAGNDVPGVETWIQLLSWDNITCKGHFPVLADKYMVWGPIMEAELKEYYNINADDIYTCGVPHFDLHIDIAADPKPQAYLTDLALDPAKPYMFFAMSSPRFAPFEIDIVEWLARKVVEGKWTDMQFVVRPHPQNVQGSMADKSWLPRLDALNKLPGVAVDYPSLNDGGLNWSMQDSDMIKMANLLTGSLVVLNSGSTVCIDAMMHNKPVILTSFDGDQQLNYWRSASRLKDFTHLKKLIAIGGISVTGSYDQLKAAIDSYIADSGHLQKERELSIQMECYSADGMATQRVKDVLTAN